MSEAREDVNVPVVFVGHAELPEGVRSAVEMILGPQENLSTVQLGAAADPAETARQIGQVLDQMHVNAQVGALVLADLQGGSPSNAAAAVFLERRYVRVVAGLSLPMALEVLVSRQGRAAGELAEVAVAAGQRSVTDVSSSLEAVAGRDPSGGATTGSAVDHDL
jgi:mannose/fructose/sorbose-specific phosphotransferase system IIA component